jgi:hypothetical protein
MVPSTDTTTDKGLTSQMDSQCREFLRHIQHIIFYAVPILGTNIAKFVSVLKGLKLAGIVDNLKPFQQDMAQMFIDFHHAIRQDRPTPIPIYAFAEKYKYKKVKSLPKQQLFPFCAISKMTDLRSFNTQIYTFPMNLQFYQSSTLL